MHYDPGHDLARRYPHISVHRISLGGALAAAVPARCLILIDEDQDKAGWNSCLAHEIVHLDRGDRCTRGNEWLDRKLERAVDLEAARRLIPLERLAAALLFERHPEEELARELAVDVPTLTVRLHRLDDDERTHLDSLINHAQDWGAA